MKRSGKRFTCDVLHFLSPADTLPGVTFCASQATARMPGVPPLAAHVVAGRLNFAHQQRPVLIICRRNRRTGVSS
jgi:hypothetical protein